MYPFDITTLPLTAKTVGGIDTLYYFYETNQDYDNLYLDIIDQIEDGKAHYLKKDIPYKNNDIAVEINGFKFSYGGYKDGFNWLNSIESLFTFGFKDPKKMRNLNDIQVQINSVGNYSIGLKTTLALADNVVKGYITGLRPITRIDVNAFVQFNFSWANTDMFIARQLKREKLRDMVNGRRSYTLYVGGQPFMLRMYDKLAELKKSKKKEIMEEYFQNNGLSLDSPIANIEFEMHRSHLKRFKINTVDDALENAEALFKQSMDAIRLVNLETLTKNELLSDNRNRAQTLPVWEYIKENYSIKEFLQLDMPLERIKRKVYVYTADDAVRNFIALEHKCNMNGTKLDYWFFEEVKRQKSHKENALEL